MIAAAPASAFGVCARTSTVPVTPPALRNTATTSPAFIGPPRFIINLQSSISDHQSAISWFPVPPHPERTPRAVHPSVAAAGTPPKKKLTPGAWEEARALVYTHRHRLALGLGLMLVSRAAGLVAPFSTKYFVDDVITQQ